MSQYFNTLEITRGFLTALTGSLFIYLAHWGVDHALVHTVLGLLFLYLLLPASAAIWFWTGFFSGIFWFWWIGLSFIHYQLPWAIPFAILAIGLGYGVIFWLIAKIAFSVERLALSYKNRSFSAEKPSKTPHSSLLTPH
jgi:apolipoprotein N-acyltransferase